MRRAAAAFSVIFALTAIILAAVDMALDKQRRQDTLMQLATITALIAVALAISAGSFSAIRGPRG